MSSEADPMTDLVIPTKDLSAFAMDPYVDLLAEDVECSNMIKWWTARRELVRQRLSDIIGEHEIGTVNGQPVLHYEYQNRFNSTAFQRKYPNLYRAYVRPITQDKFDPDLLKSSRPELYHQFQVRAMRVNYEAPGS